ncbi:PaaI family thioesterase [Pseudooceanicola sp. CBS1P-1]|uniref:Thioesterase n=1 Tax=Pseudooceanicola albus TaxID=2692189 RepID=A0A6L7FXS7_9RHOB|nr:MULTISPECIES: PaaI family thioesterase [Pseudooceanicola]MBT9383198.1 PaaI family thioesterase [Pseudooceanicola endophyticus]MXN16479.1 thioesterase [Pseudooceanicola albus]
MDLEALRNFLRSRFPQVAGDYLPEEHEGRLVLRLRVGAHHLRPGGTVSGPALFGLADVAFYLALLARIGPQALAVTTSGQIDFMRKPGPGRDVLARPEILKLGRRLAVGEVRLYSEGLPDPVARAALTYAIPPDPGGKAGA